MMVILHNFNQLLPFRVESNKSAGPSEATEKWGVKNQISAEISLLLTNFAPFLAKVGGANDPPAPLLPKALVIFFTLEKASFFFST